MRPESATRFRRSLPQIVAGVVVCGLALVALHGAWKLPVGTIRSPEAGFVPLVEAVLLALAGMVLTIGAMRRFDEPPIDWPTADARRMVIHLSVALLGFVLLLPALGFTPAAFLFLLAAISAWRKYRWWHTAAYALTMAIVLHLVFSRALQMSLPAGWWTA
jgi:hypothetical protein